MSMEKTVAKQVRDLFFTYGVTFKYGAAHILAENKERARVYAELLEKFSSEIVAEAISEACLESPLKMPGGYAIVSHCRRIRAKRNSILIAAGEQRGMDETHKFDFESGEWLPK